MYLSFYRLTEYPFAIGCSERYFYESAIHAEALANMLYTIQQRKGMVLISGEVGAGKTFMGNMLSRRLCAGATTMLLKHPPQTSRQLLLAMARGLGLKLRATVDTFNLVEEVEASLVRLHERGRLAALIVDEGQDLLAASLEELRLLWNWERDGQRLLQIVLMGQPEIRQRLLEPKWESLRQRITLSYHLGPLSANDSARYIAHRLAVAGAPGEASCFSPDALREIYEATGGIPRLINILCDNALLAGFAKGARIVDGGIVDEVLRDMTCWGLTTRAPSAPGAGAVQ